MGEALVEASADAEDECPIGDDLTEGAGVVGHLLHAATVVGDGEVALDEVTEFRLQLDGARLPVAEEEGLDGEPGVLGRGALGGDDLGEVVGEGPEDPGLDNAVHACPVRGCNSRGVEVDVILDGELAEGEQKLITPSVEVTGVDVEDDRDEAADVGDGDRLRMQIQEGSSLVKEQGRVEIGGDAVTVAVRGLRRAEGVFGGGALAGRARQGGIAGGSSCRGLLLGLRGACHGGVVLVLPRLGEALCLQSGGAGGLLRLAAGELVILGGLGGGGWGLRSRACHGAGLGGGAREGVGATRRKAGAQALHGRAPAC
ncbi:uncharacterized protein LOC120692666 [Panicum virgatum]|uniref:uncharacterized protein LOC120692666 n=1 Tax=Panicum virgatum TaxID=38727 RepID=UPI0019D5C8CD|nr:uncharacterized protein LOC120692666 [Panicum virgatum]